MLICNQAWSSNLVSQLLIHIQILWFAIFFFKEKETRKLVWYLGGDCEKVFWIVFTERVSANESLTTTNGGYQTTFIEILIQLFNCYCLSSGAKYFWKEIIMTESTRKLSNFNCQWTKILYQNNLKHIAFFFRFFNCWRCN